MRELTLRLTADNAGRHLKRGDLIVGGEDLGKVVHARITRDGNDNLMVYGEKGRDVLGLPSTVTVKR